MSVRGVSLELAGSGLALLGRGAQKADIKSQPTDGHVAVAQPEPESVADTRTFQRTLEA